MSVKSDCMNDAIPYLNMNCCTQDYGRIKSLVFIKKSDCISDDNGNFVRMKRKYGKFTRPLYNSKAEMMAYL